jgi:hypothetical protein
MVFAKLKNFLPSWFFSSPNFFLFQNTKKSFGGKKINLAKKVGLIEKKSVPTFETHPFPPIPTHSHPKIRWKKLGKVLLGGKRNFGMGNPPL